MGYNVRNDGMCRGLFRTHMLGPHMLGPHMIEPRCNLDRPFR